MGGGGAEGCEDWGEDVSMIDTSVTEKKKYDENSKLIYIGIHGERGRRTCFETYV